MEGENSNVADASEFCHFEVVAEDAFCTCEQTHTHNTFTILLRYKLKQNENVNVNANKIFKVSNEADNF